MTATKPRGIVLRAATPGDAPFIQRVHEDSIRNLGIRAYSRAEVESWAAGLRPERYVEVMTAGSESFILAETREGAVVGFCSFGEGEVLALYVHSDHAGRGIGRALLRAAEKRLVDAGHYSIHIGASLSAEGFYNALGYVVTTRRRWVTRGGLEVDVVDMAKTIDR